MNSLSWFLYFTDVLGNLSVVSRFFAFFFGVGFLVSLARFFISRSEAMEGFNEQKWLDYSRIWKGWSIAFGCLFWAMISLAILIPSQNTMYAIAASEIGEKILKD